MSNFYSPDEIEAARHLLHHVGHPDGWQPGSFSAAFITCLERADAGNRERLLSAFPAYRAPLNVLQWSGRDALAETLKGSE